MGCVVYKSQDSQSFLEATVLQPRANLNDKIHVICRPCLRRRGIGGIERNGRTADKDYFIQEVLEAAGYDFEHFEAGIHVSANRFPSSDSASLLSRALPTLIASTSASSS